MKDQTFVSFRCPSSLAIATRVEAAKQNISRSQYILLALREKLERDKGEDSFDGRR